MAVRRVNLYGGPGSGKSTIAARLYGELNPRFNAKDKRLALVTEWIKYWAYQGRVPRSYDQAFIFGNQLHEEDHVLAKVDALVTDSPLMVNAMYGNMYGSKGWEESLSLALKFEADYPAVNIFLDRRAIPYEQVGRYQTYGEAVQVDKHLYDFLTTNGIAVRTFRATEYQSILDAVSAELGV